MADAEDTPHFLDKAQEGLAVAMLALEHGYVNEGDRSTYFPAYRAAIAALLNEGIVDRKGEWPHAWVQAAFTEQLISRRKLYPSDVKSHSRRIATSG